VCRDRPTPTGALACARCFDKGELEFTSIAKVVQELGALCLVVINNVHGPAIRMFADDYDSIADEIRIPCVMISKAPFEGHQ